jgi:DMSO/TMAO reductase YedYZ molybdopterin-dependent catalytic subunit
MGSVAAPVTTVEVARAAAIAAASPIASPVSEASIELTGLVAHPGPVSVSELQRLPAESVAVTYISGDTPEEHTFTGTRLYDALEANGFAFAPDARNPLLTVYLVITANDGYQVVLSGGDIDPRFGNMPILLAWEQDGAPLRGDDGPLRLVVPGDVHGGRFVYGIVSIDVRSIAGPTA